VNELKTQRYGVFTPKKQLGQAPKLPDSFKSQTLTLTISETPARANLCDTEKSQNQKLA
jgi:hypothetical protein